MIASNAVLEWALELALIAADFLPMAFDVTEQIVGPSEPAVAIFTDVRPGGRLQMRGLVGCQVGEEQLTLGALSLFAGLPRRLWAQGRRFLELELGRRRDGSILRQGTDGPVAEHGRVARRPRPEAGRCAEILLGRRNGADEVILRVYGRAGGECHAAGRSVLHRRKCLGVII